jgi:hypothetical protein
MCNSQTVSREKIFDIIRNNEYNMCTGNSIAV